MDLTHQTYGYIQIWKYFIVEIKKLLMNVIWRTKKMLSSFYVYIKVIYDKNELNISNNKIMNIRLLNFVLYNKFFYNYINKLLLLFLKIQNNLIFLGK